jgi:hypothetical protein
MNEEYLPLGTIVRLNNSNAKVMIIARGSLYNKLGDFGYFDYSAVPYPFGLFDSNNVLFFNQEDVQEVIFKGYKDDEEAAYISDLVRTISEKNIQHLRIEDKD